MSVIRIAVRDGCRGKISGCIHLYTQIFRDNRARRTDLQAYGSCSVVNTGISLELPTILTAACR
jgi:hypothetical protein